MKRVVFVSDILARGGASVWLRRLCRHLPQQGWTCKLVMADPALPYDNDWHDWPCEMRILPRQYSLRALVHSIAQAIREFSPHMVVDGAPWKMAELATRHLYASNHLSGRFLETILVDHPQEYERLRRAADIAVAVAAVSDSLVSRVEMEVPLLRDKVRRFWSPVPYCTDARLEVKGDGHNPLRLAYLGRVVQVQKRILDLVSLIEALSVKGVDFTLSVIGDGPQRAELEQRLTKSLAARQVRLLGWLPSEKALEELAACDVQLLISEYEGQPISVLEAMGSEVVPVVTDLPGMREVIRDGVNGFLLPVGNMDAFASVLARLASNREKLRCMARNARESLPEKARMDVAIRDFAKLLDEASHMPLPRAMPPAYTPTRMDRLHIPQFMQELKRRWLGQSVY